MADIKPFKTFDEQIELLLSEKRRLIIDDEQSAKKVLSENNYYRLIDGYAFLFQKKDGTFNDGTTFKNVLDAYYLDMELRAYISYMLEYIEVSFKTYIAYYHSKNHGSLGYEDISNYSFSDNGTEIFIKLKDKFEDAKNKRQNNELFVRHYLEDYSGKFPLWVLVEILDFGTISQMFSYLDTETKDEICKEKFNESNSNYIQNWLHGLSNLRNICAHRSRLYGKLFPHAMKIKSSDKKLLDNQKPKIGQLNQTLFYYLFVAKKLVLDKNVWDHFIKLVTDSFNKYSNVDLTKYGFMNGWENYIK